MEVNFMEDEDPSPFADSDILGSSLPAVQANIINNNPIGDGDSM